jgi:hypothetical protein
VTSPETALLAAVAVHAGFQLTVTTLVYPALFRTSDWLPTHRAHSRAITPLVAVIYGALVVTSAWAVVDGVDSIGTVLALGGITLCLLTTAFFAAPLHGKLAGGRDAALVDRLLVADGVRSIGAVLALVGALLATG